METKTRASVEDAIAKMVRQIVDGFHPDKIILFGSHARGTSGPDSDVDLLVVMPVEGSKRKQAIAIDVALSDREVPLDLIVVTPWEFERCKDVIGSVIRPAAREGRVLYERNG